MKNLKNQIILIVVIACMLPCQVFAANATIGSYTYQNESEYAATMDEIVMPYINSIKSEGYIIGSADAKLHYEKFLNPSANDSIVIFHGISESSEKFYEFIYDLSVNNYY